jgi:hypothetical protein
MKKLIVCLAVLAFSMSAFSADTLITGFPATTGIGTFKVTSDGTYSTLTVDKINALSGGGTNILAVAGGVSGSSSVATNVAQSFAAITATAVVTPLTKSITYLGIDGSTNKLAVCTNATVAVTVVNGGVVVTNVAASLSAITFVTGVCTNKP